jgi:hypothetical protein
MIVVLLGFGFAVAVHDSIAVVRLLVYVVPSLSLLFSWLSFCLSV